MIKPKHDQTHGRGERRLAGTGTTSRLLSPSISLHVAVSFVCQSKGCWMGVNWNQFPLSDTINGVARIGQKGAAAGLWLLILPRKHARNLPPGISPVTITNPPPSKPTSFSVHTWIHPKITPVPSTHPQGRMGDRGVASGCPQSSHPQWTRDREEERSGVACNCREMYWSIFWSSDPQSGPSDPHGCLKVVPGVQQIKRQVASFCDYFIHSAQQKFHSSTQLFGSFPIHLKGEREEWESTNIRVSDSEGESRPLRVWINLRISMDDRSTNGPSTVKHFSGCALIVLLTLIVIKGLETASRLWVTSRAKVATHLFIGDITALSAADAQVTVKSGRLTTAQDGFIRSSAAPPTMHFTQMTSSPFSVVPIKRSVCLRTPH